MDFCTAVNCMDGRVQLPVIRFLQNRFKTKYVDTITEPGPIAILADQEEENLVHSILNRIRISVEKHQSVGIAVVGHHDCAGNPVAKNTQLEQTEKSIIFLKQKFSELEIIGLWVDDQWQVQEL